MLWLKAHTKYKKQGGKNTNDDVVDRSYKETYYKAKETCYKAKETYYKAKETYDDVVDRSYKGNKTLTSRAKQT